MSEQWSHGADGVAQMEEPAVSSPVFLRQAREAAGLHIAALAAALKVPVKKLEALEAGRYDELPDMTFARALASSASRHLKIDPAIVLSQIPLGHAPQLGTPSPAINAPFKTPNDAQVGGPLRWLLRPAVLAALVLLLATLVLAFLPELDTRLLTSGGPGIEAPTTGGESAGAAATGEPVTDGNVVAPAAVDTPRAPSGAPEVPPPAGASLPQVPAAEPSSAATDPEPAVGSSASATPSTAPTPGSLLSIAATGESWLQVVNGSGKVVVQRMLKAGDVMDFSAAPPYSVVLGRADAAQVTVRGRPFDVTPYARNSVARFEVK